MHPDADTWFSSATSCWQDWPIEVLLQRKGSQTISVVIPARDEQATIGGIVAGIRRELVDAVPLVDELIVVDSDSRDDTATLARQAGATVYAARDIRPDLGTYAGKGEALWKAQFVASGDVLVFIDADLTGWGTHFVTGLLGPVLDPRIHLVKGFYDRLVDDGRNAVSAAGGRVTELVARPLLDLYWPALSAVVQPLAGEWAVRREAVGRLHVPIGYGVELAALLDICARCGLDGIAQVDLGERAHVHQAEHDLAVMAAEIMLTAARRAGGAEPTDPTMWQFARSEPAWRARPVPAVERPPAVTVAGYRP